ncbi:MULTISPECIES: PepSY domain-containing protein [unclassified Vibrio]|uniref:PepSY-associated TM helix domain-containing protein n=1 Tax=Vibrio sp. HB236076 TaxID=3232307 RepID=A0AB39HBU0_9VIBR|nr:PepSY domain-containing protein [Vibrio sp. HB161653]MDP5253765.1 PepSY domain-containing protein [Vibrio sp. HB161653]
MFSTPLISFIKRLHFYIGLFVGPFIFIAALSGTLYVLSPPIEKILYHHELTTESQGQAHGLEQQINAAKASLQSPLPLSAVRPAKAPGQTTRVMFQDPNNYGWELRTLFIDPVSLEVRGDLPTYGTSGILPFRITLDYLHRNLLLGEPGRIYSELAASWLWVVALGGAILWMSSRKQPTPKRPNARYRYKRRHQRLGLLLFVGLVFFSATGLTWSKWAGGNIGQWRQTLGWVTPSVSLTLNSNNMTENNPHHHEIAQSTVSKHVFTARDFDAVLTIARQGGIDADKVEIKPPSASDRAWLVREIDRSWPSQVDSVAIDLDRQTITSRADFSDYPLVAKLIRWGIDAHMGVLFGLLNQLILATFGLCLCWMIILGYKMWWQRRPTKTSNQQYLILSWQPLPRKDKAIIAIITTVLALALPVLGVSLAGFVLIDLWLWRRTYKHAQT